MKNPPIFAALIALSLAATSGAARAAAPASPSPDTVVAEVNGFRITKADVDERLKRLPPAVRIRVRKNWAQFLDGLVQAELIYQEAIRRKYDQLPEVRKRLREARRRILVREFVEKDVNKDTAVPESELRDFFNKNRDRFRRKESVTLSHIVTKTEKEARDALAELKRGVPFAQVARERSIFEATRDSGGVMGTAERGTLDQAIEDVAFKLPVGQISEPVKTSIGWQILRVTERTAAAEAKFEDVKDDVRLIFTELQRQDRYQKVVEDLKKKGKVAVHPERLK